MGSGAEAPSNLRQPDHGECRPIRINGTELKNVHRRQRGQERCSQQDTESRIEGPRQPFRVTIAHIHFSGVLPLIKCVSPDIHKTQTRWSMSDYRLRLEPQGMPGLPQADGQISIFAGRTRITFIKTTHLKKYVPADCQIETR